MLGFLNSFSYNNKEKEERKKTASILSEMATALNDGSKELVRRRQGIESALEHLKASLKLLDKDSDEWKHTFKAVQVLVNSITEPTMEPFDLTPYENTYANKN